MANQGKSCKGVECSGELRRGRVRPCKMCCGMVIRGLLRSAELWQASPRHVLMRNGMVWYGYSSNDLNLF